MLLLVGLGNPGRDYRDNRHNIGFMAADAIARHYGLSAWRSRFQGQISEGAIAGQKILVLKPETFMNRSGQSVGEAARFYKLSPQEIFVLHDELDLAPGKVRLKLGGGAAGHNGLRSLSQVLGPDFWRLRLGIGHPGHKGLVTSHVLGDFAASDQAWLDRLFAALGEYLPLLLSGEEGKKNTFVNKVNTAVFLEKTAQDEDKDRENHGL